MDAQPVCTVSSCLVPVLRLHKSQEKVLKVDLSSKRLITAANSGANVVVRLQRGQTNLQGMFQQDVTARFKSSIPHILLIIKHFSHFISETI